MSQMKRVLTCSRLNIISLDCIDHVTLVRLSKTINTLRLLPRLRYTHECFTKSPQSNLLVETCNLNPRQQIVVRVICSKNYRNSFGRSFSTSTIIKSKQNEKRELVESHAEDSTSVSTSVMHTVKETSKTAVSTVVIIMGLMAAISITYAIVSELFSVNSAHRIYSKTFAYVSKDKRILNVIGDQIKGFGEETRRGRRQHVSHVEYHKDGRHYLRMKFYIKGTRGNGTVNLEMVENDQGKYEYRYLFVVVDSDPNGYKNTIILEDNRSKFSNGGKSLDGERSLLLDNPSSSTDFDLSLK